MGTLLHHCVKVHTVIEQSFGVVSGVGPGIHVLDGSPRASRGRVCFWHGFQRFAKIFVQYLTVATYGYILVCEKIGSISVRTAYRRILRQIPFLMI